MDKTKESVKDLFSRIGKEVSLTDGDAGAEAHLAELKQALLAIDIPHTDAAIHDVMAKLDVNHDGGLSLIELAASLSAYRRKRRHAVAKVLHQCSVYLTERGQSATRIFTRLNSEQVGAPRPSACGSPFSQGCVLTPIPPLCARTSPSRSSTRPCAGWARRSRLTTPLR